MIGVVDYEAGNIASVRNALAAIGCEFLISADEAQLAACQGIILPGVGAAPGAMDSLTRRGLTGFLKGVSAPFLGICLGMQLLYEASEEGKTSCLGIVPGSVTMLGPDVKKIPHMGWNRVTFSSRSPLYAGIEEGFFYFAHSYAAPVGPLVTGTAECGSVFAAAVRKENFFGVQFHPEKSGQAGLRLLQNFVQLCSSFPQ